MSKEIDFDKRSSFPTPILNLGEYKKEAIKKLNKNIYNHITITSNLPEWKQLRYLEEKINGTDNPKYRAIKNWKDKLILDSNEIEKSIMKANSTDEVELAISLSNLESIPN